MTLAMVGTCSMFLRTFSFNSHVFKAISNNCAIKFSVPEIIQCTGYLKFLVSKITFKFGLQTFSSAVTFYLHKTASREINKPFFVDNT